MGQKDAQEKTFSNIQILNMCGLPFLKLIFVTNTKGEAEMIQPHFDEKLNLTTFVVSDRVTAAEIEEQVKTLYRGKPSLHAMWDFTEGDVSVLSPADISGIAQFVKTASHSRSGGRTALVFPTTMLTEMAPLLESISEIEVPDAKIKIFNDLGAALTWIKA